MKLVTIFVGKKKVAQFMPLDRKTVGVKIGFYQSIMERTPIGTPDPSWFTTMVDVDPALLKKGKK